MLFGGAGETSCGWDLALNVPGLALSVSGSKSTGDLGEPTATREEMELFCQCMFNFSDIFRHLKPRFASISRLPSARASLPLRKSLQKSYGILWIMLKVIYRERVWISIQHLDHITEGAHLASEGQPTYTQQATATPGLPEPPHGMALAINSRKNL